MVTRAVSFKVVFVLIGVVALVSNAQAGLITGVSASASDTATVDPIVAVNGSGLLTGGNYSTAFADSWCSGGGVWDGEYITIDLEKNYTLSSTDTLKVWNYNGQPGYDRTIRGIQRATFWYLPDDGGAVLTGTTQPAGTFTQVMGVTTDAVTPGATFDQANNSETASISNWISFNSSITARYIRIQENGGKGYAGGGTGYGNYGDYYTGLSQVQAYGNPAPEPSTTVLGLSGLAGGLLCYAWRAWRKRR